MKDMKRPGLRIVKTAIAVFLSLCLCHIRSPESMPFYGAIAAIICLKPDVDDTIDIGVNRVIGTLMGGLTGLVYLLNFKRLDLNSFTNYFLVSLIVILLIWLMANLNKPNAISIMCIVFISIVINHGESPEFPVNFALNRVIDTLVGVLVAIFINWSDFEIRKKINNK